MLFLYNKAAVQISDIKSYHTKARFFKIQVGLLDIVQKCCNHQSYLFSHEIQTHRAMILFFLLLQIYSIFQVHIFRPTNITARVIVGISECDNDNINSITPRAEILHAYSTREFAFTAAYRVDKEWSASEISCSVTVRNERYMIIAKRRYVVMVVLHP